MNERIKELVSGALVAHEQDGILLVLVLEKFAELIIRECVAMADGFEIEVNRSGLVDRMKEHFGVEE